MQSKAILTGAALASALLIGSAALAQQTGGSPGSTTGPAAGGNVQPSTAVQKDTASGGSGNSSTAAPGAAGGAPGVAGKPGNKSGPSERAPK